MDNKKKFNKISDRITLIENMLQDKQINSMVDFLNKKSAEQLTTSNDDIRESMVKNTKILIKL